MSLRVCYMFSCWGVTAECCGGDTLGWASRKLAQGGRVACMPSKGHFEGRNDDSSVVFLGHMDPRRPLPFPGLHRSVALEERKLKSCEL